MQKQPTRHYKINTTVSTVPTTRVYPLGDPENGQGEVPGELADLTLGILQLHKANGDLAWVQDMASDMEREGDDSNLLQSLLSSLRPDQIDSIMQNDHLHAAVKLTLTELRADLG